MFGTDDGTFINAKLFASAKPMGWGVLKLWMVKDPISPDINFVLFLLSINRTSALIWVDAFKLSMQSGIHASPSYATIMIATSQSALGEGL